jgi:HEAT repeat protein
MILKPCPFCQKDIPRTITVCPYCHRDEQGKPVQVDPLAIVDAFDQRSFDQDLKDLSNTDPFQRDEAVVRMARRGFGIVQALASILADQAQPGLAGVARVLGKIRDRRSIGALAQAAKMGDDDLRMAAVWALSQFREPEVIPLLLSEAERPHPQIQSYLVHVLGGVQDARVLPVLRRLASHPSREVAFQAACALGETQDPDSIPALRKIWRRRDPLLREAAHSALRKMGVSIHGPWWIHRAIGLLISLAALSALAWWWVHR